ncbi:hypothetical protein BcepSauron_128 [Burkholderia phage BcepSauron]|uniref:Uncharacterized protein n=2 Tax=Sarumanvirus TaxID=2843450 RepID=A0A482MLK2_9CAUD|nr:hypothetical protein H1O16_gp129 [Burkholderia phage BcepSaruman]YP_009904506.1 hypothetical protein H1O17_gp128 [Burkholderia phage BcepSauron]QBQ74508.1 hypothetical protein BcepSauron_128 [Burkholderia phage BcepSauron]QBX06542.1 hypothetical protein BcepSaruman_129 [Burkholderia phage BcepSaruman]
MLTKDTFRAAFIAFAFFIAYVVGFGLPAAHMVEVAYLIVGFGYPALTLFYAFFTFPYNLKHDVDGYENSRDEQAWMLLQLIAQAVAVATLVQFGSHPEIAAATVIFDLAVRLVLRIRIAYL